MKTTLKGIRPIVGFIAAPMVAAVGMCVLSHTYLHFGSAPPPVKLDYLMSEYVSALWISSFVTMPIAIPTYLVLRQFRQDSVLIYTGIGVLAGIALTSIAALGQSMPDAMGILAIGTITGAMTTIVFYSVAVRKLSPRDTERGSEGDAAHRAP